MMHMKGKRLIGLLSAAVLLTALMAGCNGGDASEGGDSGGQVTITVADLLLTEAGGNEFILQKQAEFDELYGDQIKVEHILPVSSSEAGAVQTLATVLISRDAPAYVPVSSTMYLKDLYNMGLVKDITAAVTDSEDFSKLLQPAQDAVKYGDRIIGWPSNMEIPLLGFFNDALIEAGYDPETFTCETWDDYYEVAKKMTTAAHSGASIYASEFYLWPNNWFLSNGAEVALQNDDGTITLNYTDDKVIQTIEFLRKLYSEGLTNSNINYTDIDNMLSLIYKKNVASFTMYPTWISMFVNAGIDPQDITLRPFPKGPSGEYSSALYVSGYAFNSQLSDAELEAAIKYLTFMTDDSYHEEYFQYCSENGISTLLIPPYESVDWYSHLTDFPESWISVVQETVKTAEASQLNSTSHSTYISAVLPGIIASDTDIVAAMQAAEETTKSEWLDSFNADVLSRS